MINKERETKALPKQSKHLNKVSIDVKQEKKVQKKINIKCLYICNIEKKNLLKKTLIIVFTFFEKDRKAAKNGQQHPKVVVFIYNTELHVYV